MLRKSLLALLLLAIAYSQILGGIACCCCCFVRSVIEYLPRSHVAKEAEAPKFACPKCAAQSKKDTSRESPTLANSGVGLGKKNQIEAPCGCNRSNLVGSESSESPVLQTKSSKSVSVIVYDLKPFCYGSHLARRYIAPPPLGGHSWQSIACIWTN
jgi:hypothetical protein